jgi:hypothetical protein
MLVGFFRFLAKFFPLVFFLLGLGPRGLFLSIRFGSGRRRFCVGFLIGLRGVLIGRLVVVLLFFVGILFGIVRAPPVRLFRREGDDDATTLLDVGIEFGDFVLAESHDAGGIETEEKKRPRLFGHLAMKGGEAPAGGIRRERFEGLIKGARSEGIGPERGVGGINIAAFVAQQQQPDEKAEEKHQHDKRDGRQKKVTPWHRFAPVDDWPASCR